MTERDFGLHPLIGPTGDYGSTQVLELIRRNAVLKPEAPAVKFAGEVLSYQELLHASGAIASQLTTLGVARGAHIAVCMPRSVDLVPLLLGIWEGGGVYVPVDPDYPAARRQQMLSACRPAVVVSPRLSWSTKVSERLGFEVLDTGDRPSLPGEPGSIAYVLFTSGSTGVPKGVQVSHRNLSNAIQSFAETFDLSESDELFAATTICFDISLLELLTPLVSGGCVHVSASGASRDAYEVARQLSQPETTVFQATPTLWQMIVSTGWEGNPNLKMLCGGEPMSTDLARKLLARGKAVWNVYGPTETTIWSAALRVTSALLERWPLVVPIGGPIANTGILVEYDSGAANDTGEIVIFGEGVSPGYLNGDVLNDRRFFSIGGQPAYRTGDIARMTADGYLQFEGRRDSQVKIRGHRVELGEIEAVLQSIAGIERAVVAAEADGESTSIYAFVVLADAELSLGTVETRLRELLPDFMQPRALLTVPSIPVMPNGKTDRAALLSMTSVASGGSRQQSTGDVRSGLRGILASVWCDVLGVGAVRCDLSFFDQGGDSFSLHRMLVKLREERGFKSLTLADLMTHVTIDALVNHLVVHSQAEYVGGSERPSRGLRGESIAVIGAAIRVPGADNLDTFLRNLLAGVDSITRQEHSDVGRWVGARGRIDRPYAFDASYFDMSPREAELLDPQHRVFLELAHEALESAGYGQRERRPSVGVYACASMNSYHRNRQIALQESGCSETELLAAYEKDFLPARVGYKLGLQGPCVNVQSGCSSSLVAVHLAATAILSGDCEMALAGGVTVDGSSSGGYEYVPGGIMARDGFCRPFDAAAAGTVFSDGAGVVVLKRLTEALRDGDTVLAVISASAVNNDGSSKQSFFAPGVEGQAALLEKIYREGAIDPSSIGMIEAHGTATPVGDAIEVRALRRFFPAGAETLCALGAVKGNIGHLDAAAGVCGLIKAILCVREGIVPPVAHFRKANPALQFETTRFFVPDAPFPWPTPSPRRAGVTSLGIGGTNAHVVVEEYVIPSRPKSAERAGVLTISAKDSEALESLQGRFLEYLRQNPSVSLEALCYTTNVGRAHLSHRIAVVGGSVSELIEALEVRALGRCVVCGTDQLSSDSRRVDLDKIARAWERGEQVDWRKVHSGVLPSRIPLPTYPFSRRDYELLRRTDTMAVELSDFFWQRCHHLDAESNLVRCWLAFGPGAGLVATELEGCLADEQVPSPEKLSSNIRKMLGTAGTPRVGVILLLEADADYVRASKALGELSKLLAVVASLGPSVKVWIISRGAWSVTGQETQPRPEAALFWGLGRTFRAEHPASFGALVDIEPDRCSANDIVYAVSSLGSGEYAIRDGVPFTLNYRPVRRADRFTQIERNATYLVTGATGGIGSLLLGWLAERGASRIVVVSRNGGLSSAVGHQGVVIEHIRGRVEDPETVRRAVAVADVPQYPLRGVIHLAGAIHDALICNAAQTPISEVLGPKMLGTTLLSRETEKIPLSFFVLVSSDAALHGVPGQAIYAAANAFLLSFAEAARRAQVLAFGPWRDTGMAAKRGVKESLAMRGVHTIPVAEALSAFDTILSRGLPRLLVASSASAASSSCAEASQALMKSNSSAEALPAVPDLPRDSRAVERMLQSEVATLLRYQEGEVPDREDGFFALGLDSLCSTELAEKVKRRTGVSLTATATIEYPTIKDLAAYISRLQSTGEETEIMR